MSGEPYFIAADQVGSIRAVFDEAGAVVKRIEYDSFGNVVAETNPGLELPLGFACGLTDPDTQFVRFGVRDYDPEVGRWTAREPIVLGAGLDQYMYCRNDPVNLVDPDGLRPDLSGDIFVKGYIYALEEANLPLADLLSEEGRERWAGFSWDFDPRCWDATWEWKGMTGIPSDEFGNMAAAYALAEVYGPGWAYIITRGAEFYHGLRVKNHKPLNWDDMKGSFDANNIGLDMWYRDHPEYLEDAEWAFRNSGT